MSRTVMLIHGAWLTPASWDKFRARFSEQGYRVLAPAWPLLDGPPESLRRAPPPRLARVGIEDIVIHYTNIIATLDESPILMGHSFGGLIVQRLLDKGLGAVGVAIDPAPPFGVLASPRAIWSSRAVFFSWGAWRRTMHMSQAAFAADFAQTLPAHEMAATYDAHIVPSPGRIFFQAVTGIGSRVSFRNPARPPLLLIAGELDHIVTPDMVRANHRLQARAATPTDLRLFGRRSHWLCNDVGWEEVADYALTWSAAHVWQSTGETLMLGDPLASGGHRL
ncbi:MAG: alpha/beta hydrolase [Rhodocyclaceae bacterium]